MATVLLWNRGKESARVGASCDGYSVTISLSTGLVKVKALRQSGTSLSCGLGLGPHIH
jgi:hypothetical protein